MAPEFREFERLSTTVVNAFLGPLMQRFAMNLKERLRQAGLRAPLHITQSNGGVIGVETAARFPVRTLLSGPSTGVVAAQEIARIAGFEDVITFDAGGTSSDVALLYKGRCARSLEAEVHGYPIKFPMLDIHTVGAGGGSIATVDGGGLLKVGPESAGADPGPACYGKGGTAATVTDANVVLQTLNPRAILGGRMTVYRDLALAAVSKLASQLGLDPYETAQGIVSVATASMARAIRVISVQRGHDPRRYGLMAFGGSGPLHAARLAHELDMARIIVPPSPGALCALGLLMTDLVADFSQTRIMPLSTSGLDAMRQIIDDLENRARQWFEREAIPSPEQQLRRIADLRYVGQNYELQVPFASGPVCGSTLEALASSFAAAHQQRYGFFVEDEQLELVTLRVEAAGQVTKARLNAGTTRAACPVPEPEGNRPVWLPESGCHVHCPVYARTELYCGQVLTGPAIVEQMDATTLVLPGMSAACDCWHNLLLEWDA